jgi:hypothetical protein
MNDRMPVESRHEIKRGNPLIKQGLNSAGEKENFRMRGGSKLLKVSPEAAARESPARKCW